ncbi:hypothetical protein [Actinomycetospora soli]|uniref:hypothetical protein n=1 Tax=Actinomycetospora soli TaxID=2893887 RepID=UPI001E425D5A|nr:hypothetical protein [Actinomycetospora soli]MCD2191638.1 hypothetical protein [Actinomycetospora soli]
MSHDSSTPGAGSTDSVGRTVDARERAAAWVAAVCSAVCLVAFGLYLSAFAADLPNLEVSRGGPSPRTFSYIFIAVAALAAAWVAASYLRRAILLSKDPDRARGRPVQWVTACWCALIATAVSIFRPGEWAVVAAVGGIVWALSALAIARLGRRR